MSSNIGKIAAERNHRALMELVMTPGNDACADCKARAPRWASYNIGVFICVNCASIHRKIGTHITKVKSITLDAWSKEQVQVMKEIGNIKSNALYNPDETRHPPPANMLDSERDSELEKFIRSKYEFKRFVSRKAGSQPLVPPPRTTSTIVSRSCLTPITDPSAIHQKNLPVPPPLPAKTPQHMLPKLYTSGSMPSSLPHNAPPPTRSVSQPLPSHANLGQQAAASSASTQPSTPVALGNPVWNDLISLQGPAQSSSLPLQYQSHSPSVPMTSLPPQQPRPHPTLTLPPNPFAHGQLIQHALTSSPTPLVQLALPLGTPTPLASPALHLGGTNPFNNPQMTGATGVAYPFPSSPLVAHATGLSFAQQTPSQLFSPGAPTPFVGGAPTNASFQAIPQTPTPFPPSTVPQTAFSHSAHTPFSRAAAQPPFATVVPPHPQAASGATHHAQPAFSAGVFMPQQQPQFLPPPQQQQQQFVPTGAYGWYGQGV
ncbi:hypothetical protein PAXRUDRAFT_826228 [Paxillus rubicundulus Ve08.2h10]|uniref:Unplaced genomic scaffold scaffold_177, whole genome shotgun sequence n=1 Tax=Paxillus rubicundulus Ve08.2h10 TaxID=930991 RepID=A0A0D0E4M3_9AGAM|nr:hypothetical protein PAXRUDRAFT_826228 [Paxillus rubicundulus Ve08.2h10]